jgi:DNA-binding transcriptional ArsR family regulator
MSKGVEQPPASGHTRQSARLPLSDEAIEAIAARLRVISEPTRIRLMEILNRGGASVQGLAAQLGMTYYNVSKHLGILHQAGIVSRRTEDRRLHYELVDWSGWWMVEQAALSVTAQAEEASGESRL